MIVSLQAYQDVNEVFAHRTMSAVREVHRVRMEANEANRPDPPIVWIHDYHLMLAANTIRWERGRERTKIRK